MKLGHILVLIQFILIGHLVFWPSSSLQLSPRTFAGLALAIIGAIGVLKSMRSLGNALTPMPELRANSKLVTGGVYRFVRHPIYAFLLTCASGIAIAKWSLGSLASLTALFILLNFKYRYEDRLMRDRWPDAMQYQREVPALIPRIRRKA